MSVNLTRACMQSIRNRPEINQRVSKAAHIKELSTEIERLKADLFATREKNGIYMNPDECVLPLSQRVDAGIVSMPGAHGARRRGEHTNCPGFYPEPEDVAARRACSEVPLTT